MSRVFVSGRGNVYMREIAEHLVEALTFTGTPSELVVDQLPEANGDPFDNLVVAPHELFVLADAAEPDRLRAAAAAVCINTEQPGTHFFDLAMQYAGRGPVVLDINRDATEAVRRRGLQAVHLQLGCTPSMDRWGGPANGHGNRSVDIAFMGGRTPRRAELLGGAASVLWEWRTDLRLFSWHQPVLDGTDSFVAGDQKLDELATTRILLNVHRGEEPYFEWARVVEAIANGCVVVSESSSAFEPMVPNVHFVMAPLETVAEHAVALAFDEDRRAALADAAYKLAMTELSQADLLDAALKEAKQMAQATSGRGVPRRIPMPRVRRHTSSDAAPNDAPMRKSISEVKAAYLGQLEISRSIEAALAVLEHGDGDHAHVVHTSTWADCHPEISVIVPVYNQGRYLRDALGSLVAAIDVGPAVEVVVVDDHSTDDSRAVAAAVLAELDWLPIALHARAANGGLARARNHALRVTRGRYVFTLDADDMVYPNALRLLHDRLRTSDADVVAAYGLIERFDANGSTGLTSQLDWDVGMLVREPYLDGMALYRRNALAEVGGWDPVTELQGWEDYDLWLMFAERGWRVTMARSVVARSREHPGSMRELAAIDTENSFVTARHRHPRLPWPS